MDAKIVKLQEIENRYNEISDLMLLDENVSDVKKYTKLSKEQARLKGAYDAYQELKKISLPLRCHVLLQAVCPLY